MFWMGVFQVDGCIMLLISKSTFLQYQICPKDTWLRLHKPELIESFTLTEFDKHLLEQGNEVEAQARKLFPGAVLVSATGDQAVEETRGMMAGDMDAIFQATFLADGFFAKCDVLKRGVTPGTWDLFEIKGTNSKKEGSEDRDHISDLTFQKHVLELAGVTVDRTNIVHLNKKFIRTGDLDVRALFTVSDSTDQVDALSAIVLEKMHAAREYLNQASEPSAGCDCHLKGRSRHCRTFAYSHPEIPAYSVHDIVRIGQSKKKIEYFMDKRIFAIGDVHDDYELSDAQQMQVRAHKSQKPITDVGEIVRILGSYTFPLYFFDYETYAPAIPAFDGYGPYVRIPFQFSLHILRDTEAEPEHVEFLQHDRSDPTRMVAHLLDQHIDPKGTVIVWYAPFERGVNKEIGERLIAYASQMERTNGQVRDLRDIFSEQHYVHPDFRGSTSIKDVLPVLAQELSYDGLKIKEGTAASEQWWAMTAGDTTASKRDAIAEALRTYCKLDTYAMYAIWKKLQQVSSAG
jgi:Domain of unknown function(DUF2779)